MAKSKDDVKYGVAQAKLSEDEMLRIRYKHGTPLEGGKIADSEPVDLFSSARKVEKAADQSGSTDGDQPQMLRGKAEEGQAADSGRRTTGA